jgi:hypothetical protein
MIGREPMTDALFGLAGGNMRKWERHIEYDIYLAIFNCLIPFHMKRQKVYNVVTKIISENDVTRCKMIHGAFFVCFHVSIFIF